MNQAKNFGLGQKVGFACVALLFCAIAMTGIFIYQGSGAAPEAGLSYLFWLGGQAFELFRWPVVVLSIVACIGCSVMVFRKQ